MPLRPPRAIASFIEQTLPLLHQHTDGRRVLRRLTAIQQVDRWISFDDFRRSARQIAAMYDRVGVRTHIEPIPTGTRIGSGRWNIHEACDVRGVTVDVVSPVRRRVADYRKNPFHSMQWSAATPPEGVTGELFVLRGPKQLDSIPPNGFAGKVVLCRPALRNHIAKLVDKAPLALLSDIVVPNHPDAVSWTKFGWGGVPIGCPARPVGVVLSVEQGDGLRALARRGPVRVNVRVDVHRYQGTHEMVNGVIAGCEPSAGELWVLAHSIEPGALDNASGVAACVEMAQVIEELIAAGKIARPRRAIRMMHGFECYSFFWAFEHARKRYGEPVAGAVVDSVGARPDVVNRGLGWYDTVASSPSFVNEIGAGMLEATLGLDNPGYRLIRQPFIPTSDNLVGDPAFGFPCPWMTTCVRSKKFKLYDAYHSSADTPAILFPAGLKACSAAMAGYLLFLADLSDEQAVELAEWEAAHARQRLSVRKLKPHETAFERDRARVSLGGLRRFVRGRGVRAALAKMDTIAKPFAAPKRPLRGKRTGERRVPRRIAPLTPTPDNTPKPIVDKIAGAKLAAYSLYWADGRRTLREIRERLMVELGRDVTRGQVAQFFEAHVELGYVVWV